MAKGLAIMVGLPKKAPSESSDDEGASGEAAKDEDAVAGFAREAFSALKDDDEAGFVDAFTSAVKACMDAYGPEEP